jgi:hypothetical protein
VAPGIASVQLSSCGFWRDVIGADALGREFQRRAVLGPDLGDLGVDLGLRKGERLGR